MKFGKSSRPRNEKRRYVYHHVTSRGNWLHQIADLQFTNRDTGSSNRSTEPSPVGTLVHQRAVPNLHQSGHWFIKEQYQTVTRAVPNLHQSRNGCYLLFRLTYVVTITCFKLTSSKETIGMWTTSEEPSEHLHQVFTEEEASSRLDTFFMIARRYAFKEG
jgi:hypothetical protein